MATSRWTPTKDRGAALDDLAAAPLVEGVLTRSSAFDQRGVTEFRKLRRLIDMPAAGPKFPATSGGHETEWLDPRWIDRERRRYRNDVPDSARTPQD